MPIADYVLCWLLLVTIFTCKELSVRIQLIVHNKNFILSKIITILDGTGKLYGVDFSPKMVNMATRRLQHEIEDNKVFLHLASVTKIPYDNDTFHRIIHTNAYYFWPDMDEAIRELYRVIKPDGTMVCVLNLERLKEITELQLMQCGNVDPDRYMESLKRNGFQDVQMNNLKDHKTLQAIFATAIK